MQTNYTPEGLVIGAIVNVTVGVTQGPCYTNVIFDGWCPEMQVLRFKTGDDKKLIFISTVGQCITLTAGSIHTEAPGENIVPEIDLDALNEATEEGEGGSDLAFVKHMVKSTAKKPALMECRFCANIAVPNSELCLMHQVRVNIAHSNIAQSGRIRITSKPPIDVPGLEVDTEHDIISYDSDVNLFTIRNPESSNGICHVSGQYCQVSS